MRLAWLTKRSLEESSAHVAGDHVAGGELDDVAGHQVAERDLSGRAIAHDGGGDVDHGLELGGGGVGAGFLQEAEADAEDHHHGHDGAGARVAGRRRKPPKGRQQNHQRVAGHFQQADEPALLAFLRDFVRARGARAFFSLGLRQALRGGMKRLEEGVVILRGGVEDGRRDVDVLFFLLGSGNRDG